MGDAKTKLALVGFAVACGFLAGCAWDDSSPPYHTVIHYDPSRAQTYVSNIPSTNTPSTTDWKTNEDVGVGYGTTGPNAAAAPGAATGGAASTPSGVSYGTGSGTPTTASGTPGTIINPSTTAPIGTSPSAASTINTGPSVTGPQLGAGLNTTPYQPSSTPSPSLGTQPGIGVTNTGSSGIPTNRFAPLTNSFAPNGLNRPSP
jgi:hypothetical protein